jgi:hypothetical protein
MKAKTSQEHRPRNQDKEKQRSGAKSKPSCIGAKVAGLPALQNRSAEQRDSAEQPGDSAEDCDVNDPLKHKARER